MKLLFGILLCLLPVFGELFIDYFVYLKNKMEDNHALTASARVAIMVILTLLNPSVEMWRSALLTFSFHLLFFPIAYNLIALNQRFDYLSKKVFFDKIEQWVRDRITTPGVYFFKLAFLMTGVKFYVDPLIY